MAFKILSKQEMTDELQSGSSLSYPIRFVGSIEILKPMKDLDHAQRTNLARECIIKTHDAIAKKPHKSSGTGVQSMLAKNPVLDHSNLVTDATISINATHLLISAKSGEIITRHQMKLISFACKGSEESGYQDHVAFVGKTPVSSSSLFQRFCHILQTGLYTSQVIECFSIVFKLKDIPTIKPQSRESSRPRAPNPPQETSSLTSSLKESTKENNLSYSENGKCPRASIFKDNSNIKEKPWFHGKLTREQTEMLIASEGDFLIRECSAKLGNGEPQYILSGLTKEGPRHILLNDDQNGGIIHTLEMQFASVDHLIEYHMSAGLPIVNHATESVVYLRNFIHAHSSEL